MAKKIHVFSVIKPCGPVDSYPCFGEVWWLQFLGLVIWAEWTGCWKWSQLNPSEIGNYWSVDMAEHPIRLSSSAHDCYLKSYILNCLNKSNNLHGHKLCTYFFLIRHIIKQHSLCFIHETLCFSEKWKQCLVHGSESLDYLSVEIRSTRMLQLNFYQYMICMKWHCNWQAVTHLQSWGLNQWSLQEVL
jgi:hypothetical protein